MMSQEEQTSVPVVSGDMNEQQPQKSLLSPVSSVPLTPAGLRAPNPGQKSFRIRLAFLQG